MKTGFPVIKTGLSQREKLPRENPVFITGIGLHCTKSRIVFGKQKPGVTFNFDKQDVIDFTKLSNWTMCRASEADS